MLKNELCASFSKREATLFIPTVVYFFNDSFENLDVFRELFFFLNTSLIDTLILKNGQENTLIDTA